LVFSGFVREADVPKISMPGPGSRGRQSRSTTYWPAEWRGIQL